MKCMIFLFSVLFFWTSQVIFLSIEPKITFEIFYFSLWILFFIQCAYGPFYLFKTRSLPFFTIRRMFFKLLLSSLIHAIFNLSVSRTNLLRFASLICLILHYICNNMQIRLNVVMLLITNK